MLPDDTPMTPEEEQAHSEEMHRQNDPHYFSDESDDLDHQDDEGEWEMECDFCDGTGETTTAHDINGRIVFDCPECGGTGWC